MVDKRDVERLLERFVEVNGGHWYYKQINGRVYSIRPSTSFRIGGEWKNVTVARLMCIIYQDCPVRGQIVRHLCGDPLCCNPAHLAVGTRSENAKDATFHQVHGYGTLAPVRYEE